VVRREKGVFAFFERLKRKSRQQQQAARQAIQVASADPTYVPEAVFTEESRWTLVTDLVGGVVNVDRAKTELEGAYSADSGFIHAGVGVGYQGLFSEADQILFGLSGGYDRTETTAEGSSASGRGEAEATSWNPSAYAGWTSPPLKTGFKDPLLASLSLAALYGEGDQDYQRSFTATPVSGPSVTDLMNGSAEQTFRALTASVSASQKIGNVTLSPRASYSMLKVETGGFSETLGRGDQGGNNGLALRYAPVEDDWTEARIGAGATWRVFTGETMALDIGSGVDVVFVGSPETSLRTAFFVQDLRGAAVPIVYGVDDLDDQYVDLSASVSASFSNGVELFLAGFSRQGHDYIDATGLQAGLRLNF
jgi:hypothetical protein